MVTPLIEVTPTIVETNTSAFSVALAHYKKLRQALRYYLLGAQYFCAAEALEVAESYHTGLRKDGITPEFQHQIEIAHYVRTLPDLMYPEETIVAALFHDTPEDKGLSISVIQDIGGELAAEATHLMNKNGKSMELVMCELANNAIGSIAKGADRSHNIQTMDGAFSIDKQLRYANEVEAYFLPMLKIARKKFPRQERAYENIKHILTCQTELIRLRLKKPVVEV